MHREQHIDVLLATLGKRSGRIASEALEAFTEAEWFEFISVARACGVAPILFKRLKGHGLEKSFPAWVIRKLGVLYVSSAKRQTIILEEFSGVLMRLIGDGISFIVLKGPHLAESVYRDWALRPMNDLDIWVKKQDVAKAVSSIRDMGYSKQETNIPENHRHLPPFVKEGFAPIEIHLSILTPSRLPCTVDHDSIWQRIQSLEIGGVGVSVLSLEDLLLQLSLHVCQHRFRVSPMHIYDIFAILEQNRRQIDWEALTARADQWRATKALYLTLEVVRDLLGASVPDEVLNGLRPQDYSDVFVKAAAVRVFALEGPAPPNFIDVLETKGLWTKLKLIRERVFSRETVSENYPVDRNPRLIGYYYGLHFSTLMVRYVRLALRMGHRGKDESIRPEQMARSMGKWLSTI